MNENDIALVKNSFSRLEQSELDYSIIFYETLFTNTPSARALFKEDIVLQRKKLNKTLAFAVNGLEQLDALRGILLELGKRHIDYGVSPDDFPAE